MKTNSITINIARDFSTAPGPRYTHEGKFSGEDFRVNILAPKMKEALANEHTLTVILDGTSGYGTSFLEEAFGGLIREDKIPYSDIVKTLSLVSDEDDDYREEINQYLKQARDEE
jgi:hypothetical protein